MAKIFTITEHRLIRSLLAVKTDDQIASMVGCDKNDIMVYISKLTGIVQRPGPKPIKAKVTKQPKPISLQRLQREADKARKQREVQLKNKRVKEEHTRQANRKRESRQAFKTIPFTSEGKVQVRLNSRTQVWVKPGTDIEALKKKLRIN